MNEKPMSHETNSSKQSNSHGKRKILTILLAFVMLTSAPLGVMAEQADQSVGLSVGSSGETIEGSEERSIATLEELKEFAQQVNAGEDFSGVQVTLTDNLNLAQLESWEPIGTEENPFTGIFDGQNHIVSGLGTANHPSLFGHLKNATIKDIKGSSVQAVSAQSNHSIFFQMAENTDVSGCIEITLPTLFRNIELFSGSVTPDTTWYNGSDTAYTLSTEEELLGLAQLVNDGTTNFQGVTITLSGTFDMGSTDVNWPGIGVSNVVVGGSSVNRPFKGTITGGIIKNLTAIQIGVDNMGFVAFAEEATLENITLLDAKIQGSNAVGGIVGYATDTTVNNCSVSGSVLGNSYVGGVAGNYYRSATGTQAITNSYSTANIVGGVAVGGVVGQASNNSIVSMSDMISVCFSSGNINGNIAVGGIAGQMATSTATLSQCAVSGTIRGSGKTGGLIGQGSNTVQATYSYNAATVYGYSDSGALLGANTNGNSLYNSGYIISPNGPTDGFIKSFTGYSGGCSNSITHYNAIYAPDNILNANSSVTNGYRKEAGSAIYFNDAPNGTAAINATYFMPASLSYPTLGGSVTQDKILPNPGGHFPKLISFETHSNPAFQDFSFLTTEVDAKNLPSTLKAAQTSSGTYEMVLSDGSSFDLPTISNGSWAIDGASSFAIADDTLASGENVVRIQGSKIVCDAPLNETVEVVLTAVSNVEGLEIKYTISLLDTDIRPSYGSTPESFYNSTAEALAGTEYMSMIEYMNFMEFPELVSTSALTADIYEYSDNQFGGTPTLSSTPLDIRVINNTTFEMKWPQNFLGYGKSYRIDFTPANGLSDLAGNQMVQSFYFRTKENEVASIFFDSSYDLLNTSEGSSTTGDTQVLVMEEQDQRFLSIYDGIDYSNESYINFPSDSTVTFTEISSAKGQGPYSTYTTADTTNFWKIPGEYVITYQVADPEDPTQLSNVLTRTYRINGITYTTQGGGPLQSIYESLDAQETAALQQTMASTGQDIRQVLKSMLETKYVNTPGQNQIRSFYYSYDGQQVENAVTFDTSAVPDNAFKIGFEQALEYRIAGQEDYVYVLKITGIENTKQIIVDETTFTTANTFKKGLARLYFNARVVDRSNNNAPTGDAVYYDFSQVDPTKYNVAQPVTIFLWDGSMNRRDMENFNPEAAGADDVVRTTVNVVITKESYQAHPDDVEDELMIYWETTLEKMRNAKEESEVVYDLSYVSAAYAPADFFRVLENKENITVDLKLPSDITLTFRSTQTRQNEIPYDRLTYSFEIERMYSLYVNRDAKGQATQQFYTSGQYAVPGVMNISMPLDEGMPTEGLTLYRIDETTHRYIAVQEVTADQINNGKLHISLEELQGWYVVTAADMEGVLSSSPY